MPGQQKTDRKPKSKPCDQFKRPSILTLSSVCENCGYNEMRHKSAKVVSMAEFKRKRLRRSRWE